MGVETKIEWTDHTFNPWHGCQRVSAGCERCYAETFSKRIGLKIWGPEAPRRFFGESHWAEPLKWNAAAEKAGVRRRVFCASMADVFEDRRDLDEARAKLWALVALTPALDWLLLTKRPENMVKMAPKGWKPRWPRNVWAGTTVENQKAAERRIPWLLEVPAVVRFLSCEPMLEPVDLENVEPYYLQRDKSPHDPIVRIDCLRGHVKGPDDMMDDYQVHWVIVGGESGNGARPCAMEWLESIVRQCRKAKVAVFCKQLGSFVVSEFRKMDDEWAWRAGLNDRKGGDWNEWPDELRVRQFPEVRA